MVKPGGTGNPALVISARPAPLPPSSSFILPWPSALPPPKKYTYLTGTSCAVAIETSVCLEVVVLMRLLPRFPSGSRVPGAGREQKDVPDLPADPYDCRAPIAT